MYLGNKTLNHTKSEAGIAIISRKSVCEGGEEVVNGKTKEGSEVLALFSCLTLVTVTQIVS